MMNDFFSGTCAQCRQNKPLTICRDSIFICDDCNREILISLETDAPVKCSGCEMNYSWLWGRFELNGDFTCRNCIPGGLCAFCHNPATCSVKNIEGSFFTCAVCAKADLAN